MRKSGVVQRPFDLQETEKKSILVSEHGGGMAQQQADMSSLREGVTVLFRSYGLSFSDGMVALLEDWEKTPSKELQASIDELEAGRGTHCKNLEELYRSLNAED